MLRPEGSPSVGFFIPQTSVTCGVFFPVQERTPHLFSMWKTPQMLKRGQEFGVIFFNCSSGDIGLPLSNE